MDSSCPAVTEGSKGHQTYLQLQQCWLGRWYYNISIQVLLSQCEKKMLFSQLILQDNNISNSKGSQQAWLHFTSFDPQYLELV